MSTASWVNRGLLVSAPISRLLPSIRDEGTSPGRRTTEKALSFRAGLEGHLPLLQAPHSRSGAPTLPPRRSQNQPIAKFQPTNLQEHCAATHDGRHPSRKGCRRSVAAQAAGQVPGAKAGGTQEIAGAPFKSETSKRLRRPRGPHEGLGRGPAGRRRHGVAGRFVDVAADDRELPDAPRW